MGIMTRSFLPVGQGAFYLEQFRSASEKINVVYDCGSTTDVKLVKDHIDDMIKPREIIHAVFISHLHEDHMNGLEYLLENYRVKRLYFPLLAKESRILLKLNYYSRGKVNQDNFYINFIDDPKSALEQLFRNPKFDYSLTLHPVIPNHMDDDDNKLITQGINEQGRIHVIPIESGQSVSQDIVDKNIKEWFYIPFNFCEQERRKTLIAALQDKFGNSYSLDDILDACRNKKTSYIGKVKEAYKNVPGEFNANSLVLFSGCKDLRMTQYVAYDRYCHTYYLCNHCLPSGCLYTGDYHASGKNEWDELESAYKDYYDYIGCLQIPHHGSRHNFNIKFLNLPRCGLYIISAGCRNKYRHPHGSVIRDILTNGKCLKIVNESPGSAVHLCVYYR